MIKRVYGTKKLDDLNVFNSDLKNANNIKGFITKITEDSSLSFLVTFGTYTVCVVLSETIKLDLEKNDFVYVYGKQSSDSFGRKILIAETIYKFVYDEVKLEELYCTSKYGQMNSLNSIDELISICKKINIKTLAITDNMSVQSIPEFYEKALSNDIKPIFGIEFNVYNKKLGMIQNFSDDFNVDLEKLTFVAIDIETTSLTPLDGEIIEFGAVKFVNGIPMDKFHELSKPTNNVPEQIQKLTGITNEMLKDKRTESEVLKDFIDFIGDNLVVAHNAMFDVGFIMYRSSVLNFESRRYTYIDTMMTSRFLSQIKSYSLDYVAKYLKLREFEHHRALEDAETCGNIFAKQIGQFKEKNIISLKDIELNDIATKENTKTFKMTALVKDITGLKNLYKILSEANINHFYRIAKIPLDFVLENKRGLLLGCCLTEDSDIFKTIMSGFVEDAYKIIKKYDYLSFVPLKSFSAELSTKAKKEIFNMIYSKADDQCKTLIMTSYSKYITPAQKEAYKALLNYDGYKHETENHIMSSSTLFENALQIFENPLIAEDLVFNNKYYIVSKIENFEPIPKGLHPPVVENSDKLLKQLTYEGLREKYGNCCNEFINKRINHELDSIIKNGYSVLYMIAQKVVAFSNENGYVVGSRGSVGSSFVAHLLNITEVNPLKPHWFCQNCGAVIFNEDEAYEHGFDLPDKICSCGNKMKKDGANIPFETFMGFHGDKIPDIDMNIPDEFQQQSHLFLREFFGESNVFKAGTILTIQEKTAKMMANKYLEKINCPNDYYELEYIASNIEGSKRSTSAHPGGLMIIPASNSVYDFTAIQYPANDSDSMPTTHYEYKYLHDAIVKIDALGHVTGTTIKLLKEFTNTDPTDADLSDKKILKMILNVEELGVSKKEVMCELGTNGIPEFNTPFLQQMLYEANPKSYADLIRIQGISHGEGIWIGNIRDLILEGKAKINQVVTCRDDIMLYLIKCGMSNKDAFDIMERVRKGKGLSEANINLMQKFNVPQWYIDSCAKITYLFPKGHSAAYNNMSYRIAYYKYYYPLEFYAATFSTRSTEFDYDYAFLSVEDLQKELKCFKRTYKQDKKEKDRLMLLSLILEMNLRGYSFDNININKSHYSLFLPQENKKLLLPLNIFNGLGEEVSKNIYNYRLKTVINSEQDLIACKVNKTVLKKLSDCNIISFSQELVNKDLRFTLFG